MRWHRGVEEARKSFASLVSSRESEICLVPSTTYGINIVANGLPWKPGDSVVVPANEFPSNYLAWHQLKSRGVDVRTVAAEQDGSLSIEAIMNHVDHSTRLITVSWVGYLTGFRLDVARLVELAHRKNVQVFLDAIQGLGAFPFDVEATQVDYFAADGHKWMLGPEGAGMLYIATRNLDRIAPQMLGWNSVVNAGDFQTQNMQLKPTAARFEGWHDEYGRYAGLWSFGANADRLRREGTRQWLLSVDS